MRIAVTGSIATDHLMHFPAKFADQLQSENLDHVSLSFLVDELVVQRGGCAGNISYGMGQLGLAPLLVGAVGADFGEYRSWLEKAGVDCSAVLVSEQHQTARFTNTTDQDMNQIGSFYSGAMSEARTIDLAPLAAVGLDLVLVSANDPAAMVRHTEQSRELGVAFAADPSQQLARMDGADIDKLIDGAAYLLTNKYEKSLMESKLGASDADVLARVDVRITTLGRDGVRIEGTDIEAVEVPVVPDVKAGDPTGVGDAFRAGFLAGVGWQLSLERSAQVGSLLAAYSLESDAPQGYDITADAFVSRLGSAYGDDAAAEVGKHLSL